MILRHIEVKTDKYKNRMIVNLGETEHNQITWET